MNDLDDCYDMAFVEMSLMNCNERMAFQSINEIDFKKLLKDRDIIRIVMSYRSIFALSYILHVNYADIMNNFELGWDVDVKTVVLSDMNDDEILLVSSTGDCIAIDGIKQFVKCL